jgi:hypothetical protein
LRTEKNIWTRDEVTGDWRKLHNDEFHHPKLRMMKEDEMSRACGTNGSVEKCINNFNFNS